MQTEFKSYYNKTLLKLWKKVDNCPFCKKEKNNLQHILGGGQIRNPNVMFVLINPTYRNISSEPTYNGLRTPFLGVRNFWRVLVESKFLNKKAYLVTEKKQWTKNDIENVLNLQKEANVYITNLVKCTGKNANPPAKEKISYHLKILQNEISIVEPKSIITFGIIPFKALTGKAIKLKNHFERVVNGKFDVYQTIPIKGKTYSVFPTYFPVGRGDFNKSLYLLCKFRNYYIKTSNKI